jgi:phosphoglycerate kinase
MAFKTLSDLNAKGKRILLRVDFNVPMQDGKISDATRIERALPTIRDLQQQGGKIVIMAHFGRPKGKDLSETLRPVAQKLQELLGSNVQFATDCIGDEAQKVVANLNDGDIAVLENVRFYAEEEKNDPSFVKQLASLGDVFVNDAFSASHRAHASISGLADVLPAYAGRLMEEELNALQTGLEKPIQPVMAVVGGAKVSSKLSVLNNIVTKANMLVVGGGMANTFLFAQGHDVGASLCEQDMADEARTILETAKKHNCEIILPVDVVVAKEFKANAANETKTIDAVAADDRILDVGPATIEQIKQRLATTKTVLWNGPMGAFEIEPFDKATTALAQAVAAATQKGQLVSVAGGGDTVSALEHAKVADQFSYVSTAGGAFLEWLEGKTLPGVKALQESAQKNAA